MKSKRTCCCCLFAILTVALAAPTQVFAQGACCTIVDGVASCLDNASPLFCANQSGGLYLGDGTTCEEDGFRCDLGACCTLEGCIIVRQSECFSQGGTAFEANLDCTQLLCGACCDPLGNCEDTSDIACSNQDLATFFEGVTCETNPCGPPPTGACCNLAACSDDVTPQDCAAGGGVWAGANTTCADEPLPCEVGACCVGVNCLDITRAECLATAGTFTPGACTPGLCAPVMGACCSETTCLITVPENCTEEQGRVYLGDDTTCEGDPCGPPPNPMGACCTESGCVPDLTPTDCDANAGIYLGDNTTCDPGICDTGGCCRASMCTVDFQFACASVGGEFLGAGTTCDGDPCGPPPNPMGACCTESGCVPDLTPTDCAANAGIYLGDNTTCDPGICDNGACCRGGMCTIDTETACSGVGGEFLGAGTTCDGDPCGPPPTGACCRAVGFCEDGVSPGNCLEPDVYLGDGATCSPTACLPGACCTDAGCLSLSVADCMSSGGFFLEGTDCSASPCDAGACCNEDVCVFAPAYPCLFGGRTFLGAGIPCAPTNPCVAAVCETCPGDVNGDGIRDGQDLAPMIDCILGADPTLCICADMDNDGSATLADIGPFVSALLSNTGPC